MAEGDVQGGKRSPRLDRVSKPASRSTHDRDHTGKEALYSTAPSAPKSSQVLVVCERCDVETGMSVVDGVKLLAPPFLWNPVTGKLWARCPACDRRSKLRVRQGQALRALLHREP